MSNSRGQKVKFKKVKCHTKVKLKPEWDTSINDLNSFKLSPNELAAKKQRLASSHKQPIHSNKGRQRRDVDVVVRDVVPNYQEEKQWHERLQEVLHMARHCRQIDDGGDDDDEGNCQKDNMINNNNNGGYYKEGDEDDDDDDDYREDNDDFLKDEKDVSFLFSSLVQQLQEMESSLKEERRNRKVLQAKYSILAKTCEGLKQEVESLKSSNPPQTSIHTTSTNHTSPLYQHLTSSPLSSAPISVPQIPRPQQQHPTLSNKYTFQQLPPILPPTLQQQQDHLHVVTGETKSPRLQSSGGLSKIAYQQQQSEILTKEDIERRLEELTTRQNHTYQKIKNIKNNQINF